MSQFIPFLTSLDKRNQSLWKKRTVTVYLYSKLKHPFWYVFNTLRPRQNSRLFADVILHCISFNKNDLIQIKISLKIDPWGSIDNMPALVQIMACHYLNQWCPSSLTHLCVTRPQCLNNNHTSYWRKQLYIYSIPSLRIQFVAEYDKCIVEFKSNRTSMINYKILNKFKIAKFNFRICHLLFGKDIRSGYSADSVLFHTSAYDAQGPISRATFSVVIKNRWKLGFDIFPLYSHCIFILLKNFAQHNCRVLCKFRSDHITTTWMRAQLWKHQCWLFALPSNLNYDGKTFVNWATGLL